MLFAGEGRTERYRKIMHQYWKDQGLFDLEEQHLVCQVRSILKINELSKADTVKAEAIKT